MEKLRPPHKAGHASRGKINLESAAAAAAEPAARTPSTAESRATGAARRRSHHAAGLHGHHVEVIHQIEGREIAAVVTLIPLRRLQSDPGKPLPPFFLNLQSHRIRQKLFKKLRRFLQAFDLIFFHAAQEFFESQYFFKRPRARNRPRRHEPAKNTDHQTARYSR